MNPTETIKSELRFPLPKSARAKRAMLSAVVRTQGSLVIATSTGERRLTVELPFTEEKTVCDLSISTLGILPVKGDKSLIFKDGMEILKRLQLMNEDSEMCAGIEKTLVDDGECVSAYLKGAFLGAGSFTVGDNGYHLEICVSTTAYAEALSELLLTCNVQSKVTERKGKAVVYVKDSAAISDFLAFTGATGAVIRLNELMVMREVSALSSRRRNCDVANLDKQVNAQVRQCAAIEKIISTVGLDSLPTKLKETADARITHRETPLKELSELLNISKSGLSHRLNKIIEIADSITEVK